MYAWWIVVGVLLGVGVAGLLSVGVFFLLAALVLTGIGVGVSALRNRSAMAVPAGVGLAVLYLAWLNREGPERSATSRETPRRARRSGARGRSSR